MPTAVSSSVVQAIPRGRLQCESLPRAVGRSFAHELLQPRHGGMYALAHAAGAAVVSEHRLPATPDSLPVINQVEAKLVCRILDGFVTVR